MKNIAIAFLVVFCAHSTINAQNKTTVVKKFPLSSSVLSKAYDDERKTTVYYFTFDNENNPKKDLKTITLGELETAIKDLNEIQNSKSQINFSMELNGQIDGNWYRLHLLVQTTRNQYGATHNKTIKFHSAAGVTWVGELSVDAILRELEKEKGKK